MQIRTHDVRQVILLLRFLQFTQSPQGVRKKSTAQGLIGMQFHRTFAGCYGSFKISLAKMNERLGGRHGRAERVHAPRLHRHFHRLPEPALCHVKHSQAQTYTGPHFGFSRCARTSSFLSLLQVSFRTHADRERVPREARQSCRKARPHGDGPPGTSYRLPLEMGKHAIGTQRQIRNANPLISPAVRGILKGSLFEAFQTLLQPFPRGPAPEVPALPNQILRTRELPAGSRPWAGE